MWVVGSLAKGWMNTYLFKSSKWILFHELFGLYVLVVWQFNQLSYISISRIVGCDVLKTSWWDKIGISLGWKCVHMLMMPTNDRGSSWENPKEFNPHKVHRLNIAITFMWWIAFWLVRICVDTYICGCVIGSSTWCYHRDVHDVLKT